MGAKARGDARRAENGAGIAEGSATYGDMEALSEEIIWVATYERVSSDDQRDRETIKTQTEIIDRYLAQHPNLKVYRRYQDDGVSGTTPMRERPDGHHLITDASQQRFAQLIVTRSSRLGRDEIDLLQLRAFFEELGITLVGISEPMGDQTMFGFSAILNGAARRNLLAQSREGMDRAAREGRYCGGIRAYGYMVEVRKPHSFLVPSTEVVWGAWTAVDVVVWIYERLGLDGWSCVGIAEDLNQKGVPTRYRIDGRGIRGQRTKGIWTAGRIRNMAIQPIYQGKLLYGRRSKAQREVIEAEVEPLVSAELWEAAQETLRRNRLMAKNTDRVYLLRSIVRCALCGKRYSGSWTKRDGVRYRCNGCTMFKQLQTEKCRARSFRGSDLEPVIWADIACWLGDPGDLVDELASEQNGEPAEAVCEAQRVALEAALAQKRAEKDRLLDAYQAGAVPLDDLKPRMDEADAQVGSLEKQLQELEAKVPEPPLVDEDLLAEIRRRLDDGLDDKQRQEIVSLLAEIVMHTEMDEEGHKALKAVVTYKFPVVGDACTDTRAGINYNKLQRVVQL